MGEAIKQVLDMYFQLWASIPLYMTIPLLVLVVWFTFFKAKAPQRILVIWCASWYTTLVKNSTDLSEEEKEIRLGEANAVICQALDNALEDNSESLGGKG